MRLKRSSIGDFLGLNSPFFRPMWRRVAVVAVCFGWAALEWSWGETTWAAVFGVLGLLSGWALFVTYDPGPEPGAGGEGERPDG